MSSASRGPSAAPVVMRPREYVMGPLLATTGAIMAAGVLLVYLLVSRHLKSIEDIALALSETSAALADKVEKQAAEIAALQAALSNNTASTASLAASSADRSASQEQLLRSILREIQNSSAQAGLRFEDQASTWAQAQQEQLKEMHGMKDMAQRIQSSIAVLTAPTPASQGPNLTVLIAAGLRLQKRTHEDVERVLDQVSRAPLRDQQSGSQGAGAGGVTVPGLLEMLSAMKKQNAATRALQESLDAVTEKVEAQAEEQRAIASTKDKRMISVLRALVTYLRVKEKKPERDEGEQARMEEFMSTVLSEVRNKTTFVGLLRAMRAQTTIMRHLGDRVGSLETKILRAQLGGGAGGGGDTDDEAGGGGGAAGGRAGRVAAVTAAAVTETQNLVQVLSKDLQKQSETLSDIQAAVERYTQGVPLLPETGAAGASAAGSSGGAATALGLGGVAGGIPGVSEILGRTRKVQEALGGIQAAADEQTLVMRRVEVRLGLLEARVRALAGDKGQLPGTGADPGVVGTGADGAEGRAVGEGAGGGGALGTKSGSEGVGTPGEASGGASDLSGGGSDTGGRNLARGSTGSGSGEGGGETGGRGKASRGGQGEVVAPRDAEVRTVEDAAATEVLQAVEDVVTGKSQAASGQGQAGGRSKSAVKLEDVALWAQHSFAGTEAFTRFSGYRAGPRKLIGLGLGSTALQDTRRVSDCKWLAPGGALPCTAELTYGLASRKNKLETVAVVAAFEADVPATGGALSVSVDGDPYVLYREQPGAYPKLAPGPEFAAKVSLCASPDVPGKLPVRALREFVQYHSFVGISKVWFYNIGNWDQRHADNKFKREVEQGSVAFTDFAAIAAYDIPNSGDVLALHDCVSRNVFVSQWVATAEISEYLQVLAPPGTPPGTPDGTPGSVVRFPQFLEAYKGAPWVSLGSLWWSVTKCGPDLRAAGGGDKFSIERMVYHWPGPLCHDHLAYPDSTMCLGSVGYRKIIVNPRQVTTMGPHYAVTEEGSEKGADISTRLAVINHFQHYLRNSSAWCTEELPSNKKIEWWTRDPSFSKFLQLLRAKHKCNFSAGPCEAL